MQIFEPLKQINKRKQLQALQIIADTLVECVEYVFLVADKNLL